MDFKEEDMKKDSDQLPPPNDDVNFPPLHAGRQDFSEAINKQITERLATLVISADSGEKFEAKMKEDEEN